MTAACSGDTILKSGCTMCRTEVSVVFAEQVVNLLTVKVSNVINPSNHLVRVHLLYYFMLWCMLLFVADAVACWRRYIHCVRGDRTGNEMIESAY